jgi:4-amino-4-deoxy-L-arabinose transferase-like glycosyltransferase
MQLAAKKDRSDTIIFFLLLSFLFLYFYKLGAPAIWNPNEAFYAETPREMLQRHDLLTPYFNYAYRFEKPVFMYWLVLPFYALMGINATAVRMPSAVSAVLGVLVTFWFATKVLNSRRAGLLSAAILAAAFDYNSAARYASPEMLLTLLITSSIIVFYRWYTAGPKHRGLWRLLFYFLCGLSTLTKGPIGIILPFLVIIVFLLAKRDFVNLRAFFSLAGFALYLAVSLPWYAYMLYRYGSQFSSVVIGENIHRFLSNKSGESALFYYFTVLPWNFLPGSVFLVPAFLWIRKLAKAHKEILFPVVWFLVVFVFFSLSKSKLPPYIYPLFPAAATIAGGWIAMATAEDRKAGSVFIWLSLLVLGVIAAAAVWLKSYLPDMGIFTLSLPVFFFLLGLWNIRRKAAALSLILVLAGMSFFYFVFLSDLLPQIERYRPYREIAEKVNATDAGDASVFYCYNVYQQNLTFYLQRKVSVIGSKEKLAELLRSKENAPVLIDKKTYETDYASSGKKVIWDGLFYGRSESQFMKFLLDIRRHRIDEYVVVR